MPPLKGHSSIKLNNECIMVFGGINQLGIITETCVMLDIGILYYNIIKYIKKLFFF